jgi:hypothetical protein
VAKCGTCGAESPWIIRTRWAPDGTQMPDECPKCAPQSFERFRSVRDGTIAMGWEYMPNKYKLRNGVYEATDELRQDTEDGIKKQPAEEVEAVTKAIEAKRAYAAQHQEELSQDDIRRAIAWYNHIKDEAELNGHSPDIN